MKNFRQVEEVLDRQRVILRIDSDVPIEGSKILDNSRLLKSLPTIKKLLAKNCLITIIGHRGRPQGRDEGLSLKPVYVELMSLLESDGVNSIDSVFIGDLEDREGLTKAWEANQIVFGENLRFWSGEEKNEPDFLQGLTDWAQIYINDAFAVAHRINASVMLWQRMDAYYGDSFVAEAELIGKILSEPAKPLTIVLGGAKEDKLNYLPELIKIADYVLIGGKLPKLINQLRITNYELSKVFIAKLRQDGMDLGEEDINKFKEIIGKSNTVVWAGAMGWYEKPEARRGTEEIARAVAEAEGFKIIAGGDTGASIANLGLKDKIDFVCSGGGVMLEYLTKGKLPAWE
ncbi:MAG: phosphoglycerate kinase [Candidatus Shapirobacteria bacterium]|jgi:phosphoglycerate kinase